ncbi:MAG: PKD domain-containing protein [Bacteroidota bacterium]
MIRVFTLFLGLLLYCSPAISQSLKYEVVDGGPGFWGPTRAQTSSSRLLSCGPDTLQYGTRKSRLVDSVSNNLILPGRTGIAQRFLMTATDTAVISGFRFYGSSEASDSSSVIIKCQLFKTDSLGFPTGLSLTQTFITLNYEGSNFAEDKIRIVQFPVPTQVTFDFAIVIENISDSIFGVFTNNWFSTPPAGQGENLSSVKLGSSWEPISNYTGSGQSLDLDFYLEPIVYYDTDIDFVADTECILYDSTVNFIATTPTLLHNRFFNVLALWAHFGVEQDFSIAWEFGDGSPPAFGPIVSHQFPEGEDSYLVSAFAQVLGCCQECVDSLGIIFPAGGIPMSEFTHEVDSSNSLINFDNLSTGATEYSWDFGDGNTSTESMPSHNYDTTGTFLVRLIASSCHGADTSFQELTIVPVNILDDLVQELSIYPNPSKGHVHVDLQLAQVRRVSLSIYNVLGQEVYSRSTETLQSHSYILPLGHLLAGMYFLNVEIDGKNLVKPLSIH